MPLLCPVAMREPRITVKHCWVLGALIEYLWPGVLNLRAVFPPRRRHVVHLVLSGWKEADIECHGLGLCIRRPRRLAYFHLVILRRLHLVILRRLHLVILRGLHLVILRRLHVRLLAHPYHERISVPWRHLG